jgi:hypothetical protein
VKFGYPQQDSVLSYLPLDVGNQWQYKVHHIVFGPPATDTTTYYSLFIVERDTIMPNEFQYQVVVSETEIKYVHIDSATACVYEYEGGLAQGLKTDSLLCSEGDWFGYNNYCALIDTATVLDYHTWAMSIENVAPDITANHTLAMDLGMIYKYIYKSFGWGTEEIYTLVYANINGTEFGEKVTSVNNLSNRISKYTLRQNYPNPFNPITTIRYQVPDISFVTLKVYDVIGNEIATLINEEKPAGSYEFTFSANGLSSGIYFYKLIAGSYVETKKMILLK